MIIDFTIDELHRRLDGLSRDVAERLYAKLTSDDYDLAEMTAHHLAKLGIVEVYEYRCPCGSCDPELRVRIKPKAQKKVSNTKEGG